MTSRTAVFEEAGPAGDIKAIGKSGFAAGTPLLIPDGSEPIEDFRPGDLVLSRHEGNPEGPVAGKQVLIVFQTESPLLALHVGGQVIRTMAEHLFWVVGRGWIAAPQIMPGDSLLGAEGERTAVTRVDGPKESAPVYNLEVQEYHTYLVGSSAWYFSVWAHNACVSRIHDDPGLVRATEDAGRTHQPSLDRLTTQLGNGNFDPGIGTRGVFGNVLEARARDGARVYSRPLPNGDAEILAKSTKANQAAVINILKQLCGS